MKCFKKKVHLLLWLFLLPAISYAQIAITGTVTDEQGETVIGANVVEKGTRSSTVTDVNGNFSLTVANNTVLQVSYLGYATREINVSSAVNGHLAITLTEDAKALEEVVMVGYGTQKKVNVVGSIATINSAELTKAPVASTANALVGKLPGLIAKQESGLPGADAATLSIRGFGSPLIIVDGIETSFNNIDANEIESVSILKDASAAVYGARAGKGVILVTTKRGVEGKPMITFNTTYTLQGITDMLRQASSGQQAEMKREAHLQSGMPEASAPFTQEQVDLYYAGTHPDYPNTDWMDVITRKFSPQQQHNLSLRGGNDRLKYYGFFGYLNQGSMIKKNGGEYSRYNLRSNIDARILDNLTMEVDLSTIIEARRFPWRNSEGEESSIWQDYWTTEPYYPATLPDPAKVPYANGAGTGGFHITSNSELSGYRNTDNQNLKGSLALNYDFKFIDGLKARAFFNYDQSYSFFKHFQYLIQTWTYNYAADLYTAKGGNVPPTLTHNDNRSRSLTGQLSLNYDKTFGGGHHVSGLLLYEVIDNYGDWISAKRIEYTTTAIDYLFAGSVVDQAADGSASEMGRASYIGRFGYDFQSKYLVEATFRYDASAKYSKETRWGFFPSLSLGWRISEEQFLRNLLPSLSNLKLRLSASQTGDDSVASFKYLSGYNFGNKYVFGGTTEIGLVATDMANPWLSWEKMDIYNAGLDFGLWKQKLYGEFDVFYRERKGIPGNRLATLPSTVGADLPVENLNNLNDRGFELLLGYADQAGAFRWDLSANLSWSRSKWGYYEEPEYADDDERRMNRRSGQWTDRIFGYVSDGLFTSQEEIDQLPYTYDGITALKPGDVRYVDTNNDGVVNWRDQVEIGKGFTPHWMGGLNINLAYKDFDLSALFQGAFDFYILPRVHPASDVYYNERWTPANNDRDALIPRLGGASSNNWGSDRSFKRADYVRLKTLTLGYTLPDKWLKPVHLRNVRLYVAGVNLFTISGLKKYHIDPEAPAGGGGYYFPQMYTVTFGLNVSL
ncbi:MAG: TonB-dependent receptor [Dysgonamonadaceae bacterium]|jgi:TonB-linked SusC/RagA family outer membrane protein|nr:TonB-dependent receptor [Dysgonamonadaceae bacterium]